MKTLVQQLQERLSTALQNISDEINAVKGYDLRRKLVEDCIKELKEYVSEHPFPDKAAEIHYYKYTAPSFYQQYFYFNMLYHLELERITSDEKAFPLILQNELAETNDFLTENHGLHRYFYSGQDTRDEDLFTREKSRKRRDKLFLDMDDHFCEDSRQLSLILAFEQYRTFLKKELEEPDPDRLDIPFEPMDCDANKSDIVALAVAIYEANWFRKNGKPFTFKQVVKRTEQYLNMDLKDYQGLDQASRSTQGDPDVFTSLMKAWIRRKKRLDNKNDQKK